jgi:hypothetical protein
MATIHISEAEAISDIKGILARAFLGMEIVIEKESAPAIVLRKVAEPRGRLLSESMALAEAHASETGNEPMMDSDFAADLEGIIRNRKPRETSAWA